MLELSSQQIIHASETYSDAARSSGLAFKANDEEMDYPTFEDAKTSLQLEGLHGNVAITLNHQSLVQHEQAVGRLPGLRIVAGILSEQGPIYLPGIILPDTDTYTRVGLLASAHDVRGSDHFGALVPFSDYQQLLLGKMTAEHQRNVGTHGTDNQVNGAEIGHAVVVAATVDEANVHQQVHRLVRNSYGRPQPSFLSSRIAAWGATDIETRRGIRKNIEKVILLTQLSHLMIVCENQTPWPLGGNMLDLSAGFTYAALQTRHGVKKPDLRANLASLQADTN
jgi:hypothetical protein